MTHYKEYQTTEYKFKSIPKPISSLDGPYIKVVELDGKKIICRMLSYLGGTSFGEIDSSKMMYKSLGIFLAELNLELQKTNHQTIKGRQWEWDLQYLNLNRKYILDISKAKDRSLVRYFFQQYNEQVIPVLPELRKQIIHNDANEWNVLINDGKVTGIIDFGDLAHSHLINELAIAITYACFNKEDPLKWAGIIITSYHGILPLEV